MTDMSGLAFPKGSKVKKPKKRQKGERTKLNEKLDKLSKQVVRDRDGNICQRCGVWCEGSNRQVSHVIPVSGGNKLRWDPLNMKVLCYHCHLNFWHKNPMDASKWFAEAFPDRWEYLQENRGIQKFSIQELRDLTGRYR